MQLIYEDKFDAANELKNAAIPNRLYKYFPLFDEYRNKYEEENLKRINSLLEGQIWVSKYDMLNDPFEYKMLYLDKEKIEKHDWPVEMLDDFLEGIKKFSLTTCFSGETENNMPMWAHYANNHKGYCVSYRVTKPELITPVFYEPKRVGIASVAINLLSAFHNKDEEKMLKYSTLYNLSLCCKHSLWEYENEYRLVYLSYNSNNGQLISLEEIGLEVESIFIGHKTEPLQYESLLKIGKSLGCNVYQMLFEENSEDFKLVPRKLH
ncbi:DUF2971 domain-containing protein [Lysinibacillus sp. S2017]|uniref:DUF2971 domain-containing protein n=2 Tax=unclassified Lysinibacillus TaxID=2636778 RepID=UPI0010929382|nr:DUF2971 domain-containing protein [Lysinibacillus sp. 2017]TGN35670.1 DUF2971 domain-containing protein [Lysinibacillus sp. S2017]